MAETEHKLKFNGEEQSKSNFCYAAVLKAVLEIYGENIEQKNICVAYTKEENKNNKQDVVHYLDERGMLVGFKETDTISLDLVKKQIDANNPIILYIDSGHYVLLYGYTTSSKRAYIEQYLIYDPIGPTFTHIDHMSNKIPTKYSSSGKHKSEITPLDITGYYLVKPPTKKHSNVLESVYKSANPGGGMRKRTRKHKHKRRQTRKQKK
jgi:ABC-type bacteriocin/lantibiotic exporter with double-glycine peptidase domain